MLEKVDKSLDIRLLKQSFLYTFILGLITHGYFFANFIISHDSLNEFYLAKKWPKAGFGRIFYTFYIEITRGRVVLPWLIGILALCWAALAVYLIIRIFDINNSLIVFLVAGILITNPTVYALTASYIHDLDADLFAMLLAVVSAYLWKRSTEAFDKSKQIGLIITAAVLLPFSLGIYQSYISVTITVIILVSIYNLLNKEDYITVLRQGILGIIILLVAAGLYIAEIKLFEVITGVEALTDQNYNGLGNMSQVFSGNVVGNIIFTYGSFVQALKNLIRTSYPEKLFLVSQVILAVCMMVIACLGFFKLERKSKLVFLLLGVVMPFGMNIASFLSNGIIHVLMQYAIWFIYLFALILVMWIQKENILTKLKKVLFVLVVVCTCLMLFENIQTANTIYVKKELEYESTLSYMTRVIDRMEKYTEYVPGETPVIFVGEDAVGETRSGFENYYRITGVLSTSPLTYFETYEKYFKYVLGTQILIVENDGSLVSSDFISKMPVFPDDGSIQMIKDVMIVKLASK